MAKLIMEEVFYRYPGTKKDILNGVNAEFPEGKVTAIMGRSGAGKSTLLNALLHEERAIVSDICGTTRDTVEGVMNLSGVTFRFIDTAGIRNTEDKVEKIGVEKAKNLTPCEDKTEVKGENLGFFKKYFGGVGQYNPLAGQNQAGRM